MHLKIENLCKTYSNGVKALNNISLDIPAGMFGLLGPNGAGKSSLMRTIATLQDADSGSIFLDGLDVLKNKSEVRKILGYLPQEFGVYPKVSAEELLDHMAVLKGISSSKERKETVASLLQQTNLYDARKRKLGTFSGGMKQRFGIAQALLGNPKLVIVDEPTAGLDPAERNRFLNLLSEIGENIVVILSTHIVEDVSDLCRNMAIIYKGNLLLIEDPLKAIDTVKGTIWQKTIEKHELKAYSEKYNVIYSRLFAGKTIIHVASSSNPGDGFATVAPDLKDVYFTSIQNHLQKQPA
jgi:ABC-2 type transport system ATP-binding protein